MGKHKDYRFWDSAKLNAITYQYYYRRLQELAISVFDWKNLPDSVDARFLELCLFNKGTCVFFRDEVMGELALNVMINGTWDIYNIPTKRRAFATNGYQRELTEEDSVLIFNNMLHTNSAEVIDMYARRIAECERTADVNMKAQKTPVIILCDEDQRLTMKNLYMKYEGNEPFIFGDTNIDLKNVTVLRTDAPYMVDKIQSSKTTLWNEALTYLGITNINILKKERLVSDEVQRSMGSTVTSRFSRLQARKDACKKINQMFGLNIDVEYKDDIQLMNEQGESLTKVGTGKPEEDNYE